jgi:SAM-dependent methyltransferase
MLRKLLAHPLTRDLPVDDPRTTELRWRIVREKPFLQQIYRDWYADILLHVPLSAGKILEIGSGPGFLCDLVPDLITSEVFWCNGVKLVTDARRLPFANGTLRAIVMTDVLHHVPSPKLFLSEAQRTLVPAGRIVMIEPWVSPWSKFIYSRVHSEPFRTEATDWGFPPTGPLSGANGAMPWLIFHRDRAQFEHQFPGLRVLTIKPMMPFRYLASGGVSLRSLMPRWTYEFWRGLEQLLSPVMSQIAMFALIVVERAK